MPEADPLEVRLFGYGVPYRASRNADGTFQPLETDSALEAEDLSHELNALVGLKAADRPGTDEDWAVSMAFGRCGVGARPREYLKIYHAREAYLDLLGRDGLEEKPFAAGEVATIFPGTVVRIRARPLPSRRVLVGFQTEDRTPLLGNAAPFTLDSFVPDAYDARFVKVHQAFQEAVRMAGEDSAAYAQTLDRFFGSMAEALKGKSEIAEIQEEARLAGSYSVADEKAIAARQRALLNPEVIDRVCTQDSDLFRFPGTFGGITTLFTLLS